MPGTYSWDVTSKGWWTPHRRWLITAGVVLALTALSSTLAVRTVHSLLNASFRERSLAYVTSFAASASPWFDPLQPAMLQSAARFMLVGSVQYVQIVWDGDLLVDERAELSRYLDLEPVSPDAVSGIQDTRFEGATILDVLVPAADKSDLFGAYVRIGVDASSVAEESRIVALWAAASGLSVDLVLLALVSWLSGIWPWTARRSIQQSSLGATDERTIGDLNIDAKTRRVTYKGHPVRLTPKQYALIAFLAREPDCVFSDREIVEGVWPSSEYADAKDVKQYVYLVRRRLESVYPDGRRLIETVPGFGYRMVSHVIDDEMTGE